MTTALSNINWKKVLITLLVLAIVIWAIYWLVNMYKKNNAQKRVASIASTLRTQTTSPDLPPTVKYSDVVQAVTEVYNEKTGQTA